MNHTFIAKWFALLFYNEIEKNSSTKIGQCPPTAYYFRKVKLYKKSNFFSADFCMFLLYHKDYSAMRGQKEEKCARQKNTCKKLEHKSVKND